MSVPEACGAPPGLHHGVDLRQPCEEPADLRPLGRTRQHLAVRIDHIGEGRSADLGVAEEVGEEAQVDFGDGDAGIEAGMRHRDRHEGAGIAEIGRRVADALAVGVGEADVAGEVGLASDGNRGAGEFKLLAAIAVE